MKSRMLPVLGAVFWILGLILFLTGLNIHTSAGQWMTVTGNIVFFLGLGLEGVYWMKSRREKEKEEQE